MWKQKMTQCLFPTFYRRWMFIFYIVLSLFVLLFMFQVRVPTGEILQVVGWSVSETNSHIKSMPCLPATSIVFLKTHKSASSSIQNIFMRYASQREITVAVPKSRNAITFSTIKPFQKDMISGVPWENLGFNILCHHMVFNGPVIKSLMPKDTLYISVVREPVSLFESLYEYAELEEFYKMDIEEYASNTKNTSLLKKLQQRAGGMGRNQMLYDFGVHPVYFNSPIRVQKAIENIDNIFDFILIAEYFDESIIILRHILCWELDDVISLTINARMNNYKKNLSDEAIKNLKTWNWGDEMLYNHFLKKFQQTIDDIGREQLEYEVRELRKRRKEWLEYCVEEKVEARNLTKFKFWSKKVVGYKIKSGMRNDTCEDLVKPESFFTSEIRQKQLLRSILNGAKVPNYGPRSLNHLLDIKYLKGTDQQIARKILENRYKYNRHKFPLIIKKKN